MKKWKLIILFLSFCWFCSVHNHLMAGPDSPLYVGVLENIKVKDPAFLNTFANPQVRVAFVKKDGKWEEMPLTGDYESLKHANKDYPASVKWTVVFDGKNLGEIESKKTSESIKWYAWAGLQKVVSKGPVPQTKIGKDDFYYEEGSCKSRPLVLVSTPNFKDPDRWKPSSPSPEEKKRAVPEFRKIVPTYFNCDNPDDTKGRNFTYLDKDITFPEAYRSKDGVLLADCQLKPFEYKCDGESNDDSLGHWFVLWPDGKVKYLGKYLQPLDAADLDKSGHSEWIFLTGEDNQAGYLLSYDNFSKSVTFLWNYH